MENRTNASVIGAIVANFVIAAAKLVAGGMAKSSGMLSEAVHSGVDGVNDLLLLLGVKRSRRPADQQHPFGHGKELYFWSLIVSCSVFAIGGGGAVVEGLHRIAHPVPLARAGWAYAALACGALFDFCSFVFSLRQFRQQNPGKEFWEAVDESKNPAMLIVIFEDIVAVLGEMIAAAGLYLQGHGWTRSDGVASVLIGLLLAGTAIFLMAQNRDLIIGESVEDEISRSIRELATGEEKFLSLQRARTMYFGPETVLVTLDGLFEPDRTAAELMNSIDRIQEALRQKHPAVKFIYVNPEPSSQNFASTPGVN